MDLLINVLCFVLGAMLATLVIFVWALWANMQDKVKRAEEQQLAMQEEYKRFLVEQEKAKEQFNQAIAELVKRRQQALEAQQKAALPQIPTDPAVAASVKERLRKAVEITNKQQQIDLRKGPEMVMQHNELELEKLTVLRTIIKDGFDPVITIRYSNGAQEMLLSAYLQTIEKGLA